MAGPTQVQLATAIGGVVDAAVAACDSARSTGELLADATAVVRGRHARARPDAPYLWVVVSAATATHARALHEQWTAALMLAAFVHSQDPEDGWMDAMGLAARARSVVLRDRQLGLGYVEDTQSASLEPIGQRPQGRKFGAFARLDVRVALVEPPD